MFYPICTSLDRIQSFRLDLNWNGSKRVHFGERSQTGTDSGSVPVRIQQVQNGSVPVWVQIGLPSTLDLLDPYRYGSTIRTSLGSLSKVYPFGSVPVEVQSKRLDPIQTGTDRIEHSNISHFWANFTIVLRF